MLTGILSLVVVERQEEGFFPSRHPDTGVGQHLHNKSKYHLQYVQVLQTFGFKLVLNRFQIAVWFSVKGLSFTNPETSYGWSFCPHG